MTLREPEDQVPTSEEASWASEEGSVDRVERARAKRWKRNMFGLWSLDDDVVSSIDVWWVL